MIVSPTPVLRFIYPTLAVFLLLRLGFWFMTFPNPDEAYYWLWGQHPALSYYDHPPFHAWVQGIFTAILGRNYITLRLPNLLSNGILFYTYFQICQRLYPQRTKDYFGFTVVLILASPLYFLFLALAWNDHWLICFALISAYWLIQFLTGYEQNQTGETKQLYGAAAALGLAILCKYNAIFLGLGYFAAIVSYSPWRKLLSDRRFYYAVAIASLATLPIVLWNLHHDLQSFQYYLDRSVDNQEFRFKWGETLGFILISIATISPFLISIGVSQFPQPTHTPKHSPFTPTFAHSYTRIAFWVFTASTLSLIAVSLVSTALYYWNILAYLLLFPLLPPYFLQPQSSQHQSPLFTHQTLFRLNQGYGLLFASLLIIHYSIMPLSALFSPEGDPDSRMLFGWETVAQAVNTQLNQHPGDLLLITTDYRSASALAYQLQRPDVLAISERRDQFDVWIQNRRLISQDALILSDDWHPLSPSLTHHFEQVSPAISIPIQRFGIEIKTYFLTPAFRYRP